MAETKPVQNGHDAGAFDVEYQMPNKAEPQLDHQGRQRSSELRYLHMDRKCHSLHRTQLPAGCHTYYFA